MEKYFVTFYSPGTMMAEQTAKPIDAWCVETAKVMALSIKERHGALPYGFRFSTRGRSDEDLDSKEIASSPFYYLGGDIETLEQVEAREPDSILVRNMRCNNWDRVITNNNSWRWTQPLRPDDIVLEWP